MTQERAPLDLGRHRSASEILGTALDLFFGYFPIFFTATLIVVAPVAIPVDGIWGREFADGLDAKGPVAQSIVSTVLWAVVVPPLVTAVQVTAVQRLGRGELPTVGGVLAAAVRVFPHVALVVVLFSLGVLVGFFAFIVPGVWLAVRWYFGAQAAVVDGRRGRDALRASAELVDGQWWRVFGVLLLISIVSGGIGALLGLFLGLLTSVVDSGAAWVAGETLGRTVSVSISALAGTLLFFDLRARRLPPAQVVHGAGGTAFLPPTAE